MRKREGLDEIGPKGRSQLLSSNACQKNETTLNTRVDTDDANKNECVSAREAFQEDEELRLSKPQNKMCQKEASAGENRQKKAQGRQPHRIRKRAGNTEREKSDRVGGTRGFTGKRPDTPMLQEKNHSGTKCILDRWWWSGRMNLQK